MQTAIIILQRYERTVVQVNRIEPALSDRRNVKCAPFGQVEFGLRKNKLGPAIIGVVRSSISLADNSKSPAFYEWDVVFKYPIRYCLSNFIADTLYWNNREAKKLLMNDDTSTQGRNAKDMLTILDEIIYFFFCRPHPEVVFVNSNLFQPNQCRSLQNLQIPVFHQ